MESKNIIQVIDPTADRPICNYYHVIMLVAIRQVIARLNHSLDAAEYSLYASFFSKDAVFNTAFGQATGPNQIAAALDKLVLTSMSIR